MVAPAQINLLKGSEFFVVETHLVSDRDWIEKNHDTAAKFLAAFKEAGDYCTEHPDEAAGMVGKFLKLDVPLVKQLMAKNHFMLVLDQPAIDYLKDNVDTLIAGNHLAGPFNYADYVYPNLLSELDKSAVHYTLPK
jgi:ABC-type nitrate/sulfonate/bicarbonate transport system substrate-binding protein